MTLEELKNDHEEYRRLVNESRDEGLSEETREASAKAAVDLKLKMDAGWIEHQEELETEARQAKIEEAVAIQEARATAAAKVASADQTRDKSSDPWTEFRKEMFEAKKATNGAKFERSYSLDVFPRLEQRTEYDVSTAGSGAYGSYLVAQTWADSIATAMVAQSGVLQAGPSILRTSQGGQINIPTLSTDIAAASITEGSAATQDTPVFGTVPLNAYGIGGYFNITEDLIADSSPDVSNYLAGLAGRALAQGVASYLGDEDVGTGSSAPAAITVGATSAVTAASTSTVTMDELLQLYAAVIPPYRVNGRWIVNNALFLDLLQSKDGNGNYLVHPSLQAGAPDMLMGKPLIEDQYFDASATGNKVAGFGDVAAAYTVRYVGPVQVDFSADAGFTSFEVVCRYKLRFDAATTIASAFQIVTLG